MKYLLRIIIIAFILLAGLQLPVKLGAPLTEAQQEALLLDRIASAQSSEKINKGKHFQIRRDGSSPQNKTLDKSGIGAQVEVNEYVAPQGAGYQVLMGFPNGRIKSVGYGPQAAMYTFERLPIKSATSTPFLSLLGLSNEAWAVNTYSATLISASTQYFTAIDSTSLSITGDLTIEAWVNLSAGIPNNTAEEVVSKYVGGTSSRSYYFQLLNIGGQYQMGLGIRNSSAGTEVEKRVNITTPTTGTWYHYAATYNTAGEVKYYVDSSQVGVTQTGYPTSIQDTTTAVWIGNDPDGSGYLLNGQIDEIRVWAAERTSTELNDNKCVAIDSAANLNASWHLDNSLVDSSGNSNTLTNVNSATFTTDFPSCFAAAVTAVKKNKELIIFSE